MALLIAPILVTSGIVALITKIYQYLCKLRLISRFIKAGPVYPLLGHAPQLLNVKPEDLLQTYIGMMRKDPELRKVVTMRGMNTVINVFHPETVEPLLQSNVHINKSRDYQMLEPLVGLGLVTSGGERWKKKRKLLTPAFHFKIFEDSMGIFNKNADTLAELLLQNSDDGQKTLDLFPYIARCSLNIILESAMETCLNIQCNKESEILLSVNEITRIIQRRFISPWLWPDWIYNHTAIKKLQDRHFKNFQGLIRKVITDKQLELLQKDQKLYDATKKKRLAFIDLLLSIQTTDGIGLSNEEIQEEVHTFLIAGYETTACAISWLLLLLANHPEIQDRIMEEQEEIFGGDDSGETDVVLDHLSRMTYLECCIKEGLRLYPSAPLMGRQIEEDDLVIDGIPVPKGASVVVVTVLLHRNPKVWEAPDEFRPDRFLHGKGLERHPYAFIPFSAGPRNCIGQKFALMEMKVLLSKLLRKVEVVKVDSVEDVKPIMEVVLRPNNGIRAIFRKRSKKNN